MQFNRILGIFSISLIFSTLLPLYASAAPQPAPTNTPSPIDPADDPSNPSLTPAEVQTAAQKITVRITSANNGGSGVLVAKKGNTYLVLTNKHVAGRNNQFQIQTRRC